MSVHHLRESGEIDCHEPVYGKAGQLLDHLHQAFRAADGIGGVQLGFGVNLVGPIGSGFLVIQRAVLAGLRVPRLALHRRDREVARERYGDNAFAVSWDVHQHHGVRPGSACVLGVARAHVAVLAESAVDADDQEVLVTELRVRVENVARPQVQRGDLVEHVVLRRLPLPGAAGQRERRHCNQGGGDAPGHHRLTAPAPAWLGLLRATPATDARRLHPVAPAQRR